MGESGRLNGASLSFFIGGLAGGIKWGRKLVPSGHFPVAIPAGRMMLTIMKALVICALALIAYLLPQINTQAQYKAPSQYFPKSYPAPQPGGGAGRGSTNAPGSQPPASGQPKFKDLPLNTGFYFHSDTNRAYLWTKTSTSQAKNTKNGIVQTISAETPVQR